MPVFPAKTPEQRADEIIADAERDTKNFLAYSKSIHDRSVSAIWEDLDVAAIVFAKLGPRGGPLFALTEGLKALVNQAQPGLIKLGVPANLDVTVDETGVVHAAPKGT